MKSNNICHHRSGLKFIERNTRIQPYIMSVNRFNSSSQKLGKTLKLKKNYQIKKLNDQVVVAQSLRVFIVNRCFILISFKEYTQQVKYQEFIRILWCFLYPKVSQIIAKGPLLWEFYPT